MSALGTLAEGRRVAVAEWRAAWAAGDLDALAAAEAKIQAADRAIRDAAESHPRRVLA